MKSGSQQISSTFVRHALDVEGQGLTVTGEIAPAHIGSNTLEVDLAHEGEELDLSAVSVSAKTSDLGPLTGELVSDDLSGRYQGEIFIPAAGQWQLAFSARLDTFTLITAVATVEIR